MSGYLESLSKSELQAIVDLGKAAEKVMASKQGGNSSGGGYGGSSQFADGGRETQR